MYYSALVMAEILSPSGSSHILDLGMSSDSNISICMPVYLVYDSETRTPTCAVPFNYLFGDEDAISIDLALAADGLTPVAVWVKYLLAESISQTGGGFTWARQASVLFFFVLLFFSSVILPSGLSLGLTKFQSISVCDVVIMQVLTFNPGPRSLKIPANTALVTIAKASSLCNAIRIIVVTDWTEHYLHIWVPTCLKNHHGCKTT